MGIRTWLVRHDVGVSFFSGSKNPKVRAAAAGVIEQQKMARMSAFQKYIYLIGKAKGLGDALKAMTEPTLIPINMLREEVGMKSAWEKIASRFAANLKTREGISAALIGSRRWAGAPLCIASEAEEVRQEILKIASRVAPDLIATEKAYLEGRVAEELSVAGSATGRLVFEGLRAEITFLDSLAR